jgi:hypothetical protein
MARKQPDCNKIKAQHCYNGRSRKRDIRECFAGDARRAIGDLYPGCEIFGFNKGQFSLMDVIVAILDQTGPASVDISTWTAANADIRHAFKFIESGRITEARWVIDRSFPTRQPEYFKALAQRFGAESIRLTRTHAKFCLIRNAEWNIVLRSSMNLNKNPRFENFEISDDPAFADYFGAIVDEIFKSPDVAEMPTTSQVDAAFADIEVLGECYGGANLDLSFTDLTL